MQTALQYIWYIFDKLINWFFNDTLIAENVSLGWVIVAVTVFGMLIRSILNIPRGAQRIDTRRFGEREDKW